jgi:hypothetical protein
MLEMSKKLVLENVFVKLVDCEIEGVGEATDELLKGWMKDWKEMRLKVSGGDRTTMGSIGMGSIEGFINEIILFEDLVCDYIGEYRGIYREEMMDGILNILSELSDDEEFNNEVERIYKEKINN